MLPLLALVLFSAPGTSCCDHWDMAHVAAAAAAAAIKSQMYQFLGLSKNGNFAPSLLPNQSLSEVSMLNIE